jgi:hypothetical protein
MTRSHSGTARAPQKKAGLQAAHQRKFVKFQLSVEGGEVLFRCRQSSRNRRACTSRLANSCRTRDWATLRAAGHLAYAARTMKDFLLAVLHVAVMTAKLRGPGGVRAVIAENLLLKQQLIVLRRARQRAPNLTRRDRLLCGFWSLFLSPGRIRKGAVAFRPSTLLAFIRRWCVASTAVCSHRGAETSGSSSTCGTRVAADTSLDAAS